MGYILQWYSTVLQWIELSWYNLVFICPLTFQQLTSSQLLISLFMCVQVNNISNMLLSSLLAVKTLHLNVLLIVQIIADDKGGGRC